MMMMVVVVVVITGTNCVEKKKKTASPEGSTAANKFLHDSSTGGKALRQREMN